MPSVSACALFGCVGYQSGHLVLPAAGASPAQVWESLSYSGFSEMTPFFPLCVFAAAEWGCGVDPTSVTVEDQWKGAEAGADSSSLREDS